MMPGKIFNSQKPYKRSLFISHKSPATMSLLQHSGRMGGGGGGTLGMFWRECAAGTLEPLAYTKASSAE